MFHIVLFCDTILVVYSLMSQLFFSVENIFMLVQQVLDLCPHVVFQLDCSNFIVLLRFQPLFVVFARDLELYRIILGCDGIEIELQSLDVASCVSPLGENHEEDGH